MENSWAARSSFVVRDLLSSEALYREAGTCPPHLGNDASRAESAQVVLAKEGQSWGSLLIARYSLHPTAALPLLGKEWTDYGAGERGGGTEPVGWLVSGSSCCLPQVTWVSPLWAQGEQQRSLFL